MKINCNSQDLKIIDRNRGYNCFSCALNSTAHLQWCVFFCRRNKVYIKDTCNSGIFKL